MFEELTRAVTARYRPRGAYYYVRTKLRMDPIGEALWRLAGADPFGTVLDVGCGRGQLGILLLVAGLADALVGVDWDEAKIRIASAAAADLPAARFDQADLRTCPLPQADTVLLVDVLHYLNHEEQDALLEKAARAARRRVVIRDFDPDQGASSVLTRTWEWLWTGLGYNRGRAPAPRGLAALTERLEAHHFRVAHEACSTRALSNVLLVATRKP